MPEASRITEQRREGLRILARLIVRAHRRHLGLNGHRDPVQLDHLKADLVAHTEKPHDESGR